jgi:hypothetical protein
MDFMAQAYITIVDLNVEGFIGFKHVPLENCTLVTKLLKLFLWKHTWVCYSEE